MGRYLILLCLFILVPAVHGQSPSENASVKLSATVQAVPPRITLQWVAHPGTNSITIYRKLKSATSWGSAIASFGAGINQYQDNSVAVGVNYEYRVYRTGGGTGNGYISTGIQVEPEDYRGRMLLLVDNTLASGLTTELEQLHEDLRADGWAVIREDVSPTQSASAVRSLVIGHYNANSDLKAVYIIGHVRVPYSGNVAPDGHGEHVGAWPCDGYYGEIDGTWTDSSVNNNNSQRPANRNIPGDGKFDQSNFPSAVELQVGRVDLHDMPAFVESELQLMSNYLQRAHGYKVKAWTPLVRGLIFDNLQWVSNPLAASAWRNISPLVGPANITNANQNGSAFHNLVNGQSYLWTYSSGGGSQEWVDGEVTFHGANNVGTSHNYAANTSMGGVFNMALGSYFGDWDNKNNFLKAPLAKGEALTNCWSGMPPWYFHHMGMGDNIGYSTLMTMNNSGLYAPTNDGWQGGGIGRTHLALMGDPSLRMKMVAPPTALTVTNASGLASFNWTASSEPVDGYYLYEFDPITEEITRISPALVTNLNYTNAAIPFIADREYMVRAVKLEVNTSGSYYNLSLGAMATAAGTPTPTPDCLGTPGGTALPGTACNDGNSNTINDTWTTNCTCVGTAVVYDCLGVANGPATPGTTCNDNNPNTGNDIWNSNCQCIGQLIDCNGIAGGSAVIDNCGTCVGGNTGLTACTQDCTGAWGGNALPGTACNDNNPNTGNDTWNSNCQCIGQVIDCNGVAGGSAVLDNCGTCVGGSTGLSACTQDCTGEWGGNALPGTACNDGNANTINDTWTANCTCVGTPVVYDCLGVANGPATPGTTCNDNNPNTGNDIWNSNCQCIGQLIDCNGVAGGSAGIDNCGTCVGGNTGLTACTQDCTGAWGGNALAGTACNDNNPNTGNDTWNSNCQCIGQLVDCNGVAGGSAVIDNCGTCVGGNTGLTACTQDCTGAWGGNALPGTACNDGNSNTINDTWTTNCTCVGTPVVYDCLGVANGPATPGTACNDNNPDTGNDTWNSNCQCTGQLIDCNGIAGGSAVIDNCGTCVGGNTGLTACTQDCTGAWGGNALPGTACNDGDPNTGNDTWNSNCQCIGQLIDCNGVAGGSAVIDNCGTCVGGNTGLTACTQDCTGAWGSNALPGSACNDGNANTINDTWTANCTCVGTPVVYDCLGVANGPATPGTTCNDNNPDTGNDTWNSNCQCTGQLIDCNGVAGGSAVIDNCGTCVGGNTGLTACTQDCTGAWGGNALPGTACNDGNANTINDTWTANCTCVGTPVFYDCLGVANGPATPGTTCNDNNPNTGNDTWNSNCQCTGQLIDCNGVAGGSAVIDNCGTCVGGNTGLTACTQDCTGAWGGNALPGTACNDGIANTINDTWTANCTCVGTPVFYDCLGVANGPATPGTTCNDNNPNTGNDTWNSNCQCIGQLIDCNGIAGGSAVIDNCGTCVGGSTGLSACTQDCTGSWGGNALPGTACNDGNANTINDTWTSNCTCVGTPVTFDCLGVANGSALPGTACNDGNPNTGNDTWNSNCQCIGQLIDCNGVAGGSAVIDNCGTCVGGSTGLSACTQDCTGSWGGNALPGTACNDGNANTINDTWTANCTCIGTLVAYDCLGQANGSALPGTPCNDNNPNTGNDTWNANCECIGQPIDCNGVAGGSAVIDNCGTCVGGNTGLIACTQDCTGAWGGNALPGTVCNDGNANTINDTWTANCTCVGTPVTFDCLGVANGSALPGTACNDGNPNTGNDTWNANCECIGQLIDCNGVAGGSAVIDNCATCVGGNTGLIACTQDCTGAWGGNALPGTACNDGNANTINDIWTANCTCVGTLVAYDCLGQANGSALPGTPCNDNNPNTGNDTWNANCECIGQLIVLDCLGVANGPNVPGAPCNDNNALTGNDVWSADCECMGQPFDCNGTPGGDAYFDQCGNCVGGSTLLIPDLDSDEDGFIDCMDICPYAYDPLQADFDGDGIGDACDNCPWVYNPDQIDTNGNGIGDECQYAFSVGIDEVGAQGMFSFFPNPTNGIVSLDCTIPGVRTIRLFDVAGSLVMEAPIQARYDLEFLPMGIYMIIALDADGSPLAHSRLARQ